jgi:TPR repeat protein
MSSTKQRVIRALVLVAVAAGLAGCAKNESAATAGVSTGFDDKALYEMGYAIKHITPVTAETSAMALKLLRASADKGNAEAMVQLGEMYLAGQIPVEAGQDTNKEAMRWWQAAWDKGSPRGYHNLGLLYYGVPVPGTGGKGVGVVPQDYGKAFEYFKAAADKGDTKAIRYVGICYEQGQGVRQDYAEAAKYYAMLGDGGFYLANLLLEGKGVEPDVNRALEIYAKTAAANGGGEADTYSAEALARIYEEGRFVKADPAKALEYYQLAARKGSADAKAKLGDHAARLYKDGYAQLKSGKYESALPLLIQSAQLGNADAVRMTGSAATMQGGGRK